MRKMGWTLCVVHVLRKQKGNEVHMENMWYAVKVNIGTKER